MRANGSKSTRIVARVGAVVCESTLAGRAISSMDDADGTMVGAKIGGGILAVGATVPVTDCWIVMIFLGG